MTDHSKPEDNDPFLGAVTSNLSTQLNATITVNNKQAQFKLDTGAEVTAISENTYCELRKPELKRPSKTLYGLAGIPLGVCGQFTANLSSKSAKATHVVYVVKGLKHNLLGLPAITSLDLVRRLHQIEECNTPVQNEFPNLFKGLGTIGEDYEIPLKATSIMYRKECPAHQGSRRTSSYAVTQCHFTS